MKKLAALLTAAAAAFSCMQMPFPAVQAIDSVNIMPIGDSITFGYGQGQDGGYRKFLDYALRQKDIAFDMVGPEGQNAASFQYNGQTVTYDNNHAGYSGFTIKQQYPIPSWGENGLLERLQSKNAIKQAQPDIVLLMIGTNDMTANRSLTDCESDLHTLLDYILGDMPDDGIVFLASIPEFTAYGGNAQRVANYNSTVKKVAESYGENVQFADVHGCLNGMADMQSDNLHPNAEGYEKIGKFWAEVIDEYLSAQGGDPEDPTLLYSDFETGLSGWKARGSASVAQTTDAAAAGIASAAVTNRSYDWNGIAYPLSSRRFPADAVINVKSCVMQNSGAPVKFKMTMQYDTDAGTVYDTFAEGTAAPGTWLELSAIAYTVKSGSNPVLYFETDSDTCDFYLDEVLVTKNNGETPPVQFYAPDVNHDNQVDRADVLALRDYLLGKESTVYFDTADLDGDNALTAKDLTALKRALLDQEPQQIDYMASIRGQITTNVPASVLTAADGTMEHITYFSQTANREKEANVWLPPGYDANRKYPVFYVNHGYGGDASSMVSGMGVREIASNLIKSGDAEPMIIVFTDQYSDPAHPRQTGNGQADVPGYDLFAEDLPGSLMPYIASHYPVKTGRENTAIAGFSMGGREALYCGMKCCDQIGYIGAGAPAPGIYPTKDQFMDHPGVMREDEIRIDPPYSPYVLMIAGGTNDGMVGDYPKTYSDLFTAHGTENIYISVPGGSHDGSTVTPLMYNFIRCIFKA